MCYCFLKKENHCVVGSKCWKSMCCCFLNDGNHCVIDSKCWKSMCCYFLKDGNHYGWFQVVKPIVLLFPKGWKPLWLVPSGETHYVVVSKRMEIIALSIPSVRTYLLLLQINKKTTMLLFLDRLGPL